MRKLIIGAIVSAVLVLGTTPAHAQIVTDVVCKTYHSFNGSAKVKLCAEIIKDTTGDAVKTRFTGYRVSGFQQPDYTDVQLHLFTLRTTGGQWCDGRAPGCTGDGDASALFGGMPSVMTSDWLFQAYYCSGFARINAFIGWPGGGTSTIELASHTVELVTAGCIS